MKRLISLLILASFISSDLGFTSSAFASGGNTNLASASIFNDIADNTPHNKNIVLAEMALAMDLRAMNDLHEIAGATDVETIKASFARLNLFKEKSYQRNADYKPDDITVFFNLVEHIGGHIFSVPISVNNRHQHYRLLFSTKRQDELFPTALCTKDGLDEIRSNLIEEDILPQPSSKDTRSRQRYKKNNEEIIDPWIERKMQDPDNYIELKPGTALHDDFMKLVFGTWTADDIDIAFHQRVSEILEDERIVLVKVKESEKRPVIYEDGKPIEVTEHSSNKGVYLFIDEEGKITPDYKEKIFENFRNYLYTGRVTDEDKPIHADRGMDIIEAGVMADLMINPLLFHCAGVLTGSPWEVVLDGKAYRIVNEFDKIYEEAKQHMDGRYVLNMPSIARLRDSLGIVDLDHLTGTNAAGQTYERDYAFSEYDYPNDRVGRRDQMPPTQDEILSEINILWQGLEKEIDNPFDKEVQNAVEETKRLTTGVAVLRSSRKLIYLCFYSEIFSGDDTSIDNVYRNVVGNRNWALDRALGDHRIITLYFMALIRNGQPMEELPAGVSFFDFYYKKLFHDFALLQPQPQYKPEEEDILKDMIPWSLGFINFYMEKDERHRAGELGDNFLLVLESIITSWCDKGRYDGALKIIDDSLSFINKLYRAKSPVFLDIVDYLLTMREVVKKRMKGSAYRPGVAANAPQPRDPITGRFGEKPHMNPAAAWEVIVNGCASWKEVSPDPAGHFTTDDYRHWFKKTFPGAEVPSYGTVINDLEALARKGYLVRIKSGPVRPSCYGFAKEGLERIIMLRNAMKATAVTAHHAIIFQNLAYDLKVKGFHLERSGNNLYLTRDFSEGPLPERHLLYRKIVKIVFDIDAGRISLQKISSDILNSDYVYFAPQETEFFSSADNEEKIRHYGEPSPLINITYNDELGFFHGIVTDEFAVSARANDVSWISLVSESTAKSIELNSGDAKPLHDEANAVQQEAVPATQTNALYVKAIERLRETQRLISETAYNDIGIDHMMLAELLEECGAGQAPHLREKDTTIFSKIITFDNGLGAYLPHIANAGIKIAVVTENDRQDAFMEAMNAERDDSKRIEYGRSVDKVKAKCVGTTKFYYVQTPEEATPEGVTPLKIMVEKIKQALGKVLGINDEDVRKLERARILFATAV